MLSRKNVARILRQLRIIPLINLLDNVYSRQFQGPWNPDPEPVNSIATSKIIRVRLDLLP